MFRLPFLFKIRFHWHRKNYYKDTLLIDFITANLNNIHPSKLEQNPLLEFSMLQNVSEGGVLIPVRDKLGEFKRNKKGDIIYLTPYKFAKYNDLCFTIFEGGAIILDGSLHKYFNSGAHNYNDFDYYAFVRVLNDLENKFGITPDDCRLQCLEVGVNILPPIPSNDILKHCFLHKTQTFKDIQNSTDGRYRQAKHYQYIVKIYNKALHYILKGFKISTEILRFELKYIKMEKVNKLGVYTLADIKRLGLGIFKKELLTEFGNILYYDSTIVSRNRRLSKYKNPLFWADLLETKSRKTFYKHKKDYKNLVVESSEQLQNQITEVLSSKIDELCGKGI